MPTHLYIRPYADAALRSYARVVPFDIEVEADKTLEASFTYEEGGKIAVRIVGPDGHVLTDSRCEIVLPQYGDPMRSIRFLYIDPETRTLSNEPFRPHLSPKMTGFIQAQPALYPTSYAVLATCNGYRDASRAVAVRAGETTNVEFRLEPED